MGTGQYAWPDRSLHGVGAAFQVLLPWISGKLLDKEDCTTALLLCAAVAASRYGRAVFMSDHEPLRLTPLRLLWEAGAPLCAGASKLAIL